MRATVSVSIRYRSICHATSYTWRLCQKEVNTRIRMGSAVAWIVAIVATGCGPGGDADVGGGWRTDFRPRAPAMMTTRKWPLGGMLMSKDAIGEVSQTIDVTDFLPAQASDDL